ncbi:MAG: ester cyclase [Haloarculaceae archaeon]
MSTPTDEAKRIARQFPEAVATEGEIDLLDDILAPDHLEHDPFAGDHTGREAAKEQIRSLREAFPDFRAEVEEIVAEDDVVAMRVTISGTHEGPFMGLEPTGKSFEVQNMVFTRIEDGRIVERWLQPDTLGMFRQLGVSLDEMATLTA